jgi:anaerobic magnesium-protoporphyrin IX monomethyl ester cyclase
MVDILFINPKEKARFFEKMPPLGLAYMAANLEKHGYSVKILDLEVADGALKSWLEEYKPRFVGISGTTHTRFESFCLAKEIKEFNRTITTIYGGVHATFTDIETLQNVPYIDYVVRGEGEHVIVQLLDALAMSKKPSNVSGIAYRDLDRIRKNPSIERIKSLDNLPMPAYHLLDMGKYMLNMEFIDKRGISTITSRGCRARCSFCSASRMFDHRVTMHSAARILDDIELLFDKYDYEGIKFFDSTLTMYRQHVDSLCDEIRRRELNFPWECEIRVGTVDRKILQKMMNAGCYYVNFGIESASQNVLNHMRKGFTVEQAQELLDWCAEIGLKTKVFFSFGHIRETMEDVNRTFGFIDKNDGKITTVASGAGVRIYPGTYLEKYAMENGYLPDDFKWSLPYDDKRLEAILQTRSVPLLLQPQLGFAELEKIALRIYKKRFSGWQGFKRGLNKITDKAKLKKLWKLSMVQLRQVFKRKSAPK